MLHLRKENPYMKVDYLMKVGHKFFFIEMGIGYCVKFGLFS